MDLYYRKSGKGEVVIVCHGLYGMSDNWLPFSKFMSDYFELYLVDMRNHGFSPHSESHSYADLSKDLHDFVVKNNLSKVNLLGHSMGGKACMQFAVDYPDLLNKLVVIDISPLEYSEARVSSSASVNHYSVLQFMMNFDFSKIRSRGEIYDIISQKFKDEFVQQFLSKNITKGENSLYTWKLNARTLFYKHEEILKGVNFNNKPVLCSTLYVKGEKSAYIQENDRQFIKEKFSNCEFLEIKGSGHMVHVENPFSLFPAIKDFLLQ